MRTSGPGSDEEPEADGAGGPTPGTPRWVKIFGIAFLVLVLLTGIMLATGHNGPGRHFTGRGTVFGVGLPLP